MVAVPAMLGLPTISHARLTALKRVRPGDPAWPSKRQWEELKRLVGGNLIEVRPLFRSCVAAPDCPECATALANRGNPYFIGDQPGGTQVSGWLDAWTPGISAYAVAARSTADVAAAVNFARSRNLRLVVKGGGHSYQGTSNAPDSLLIWTRHMNGVALHNRFVPAGARTGQSPVPAVTIGAGAMWMDVYEAVTTKAGRYVQGGGCGTVGVAGLVQSGGFGSFSKGFGTASASLIEAEIVTADGSTRIASEFSHPDLFWALKGGGGGSWGVVAKMTLMTHELPENFGAAQGVVRARSDAAFRRLLDRFVDFYAKALFNPHWGEQIRTHPDNRLTIAMLCQGLDQAHAIEIWRPFIEWVNRSPDDYETVAPIVIATLPARHLWDAEFHRKMGLEFLRRDNRPGASAAHNWWAGDAEQVGALIEAYQSQWLPATLLHPNNRGRLARALFDSSRHWAVSLHFNKGLAGAPVEALASAQRTAINPGAIDAFALAIVASEGPQAFDGLPNTNSDPVAGREHARRVAAAMAKLRTIAPAFCSYVSESDYFERDWQQSFWGANYSRLQRIKRRYDPHGLFFVRHGVGSEGWSDDGFTEVNA